MERLRQENPDWVHTLYDDLAIERFILDHYGMDILRRYQRIEALYGAARADFFRYLLMYRLGGVYLDIKSGAERPLDEIVQAGDQYIISQWRNRPGEPFEGWGLERELPEVPRGEFQQWHIISAPGHPFLRAVIKAVIEEIDEYRAYRNKTGRIGVFRTTGPVIYTRTIARLLDQYPCRQVESEAALGLVYSQLDTSQAHHRLGRPHYSEQTAPVIRNEGLRRLVDLGYIVARNGKWWAESRLRGQAAAGTS